MTRGAAVALSFSLALGCSIPFGRTAGSDGPGDPGPQDVFSDVFNGHNATFVLLDHGANARYRHDYARAQTRYSPASTFKIPNTIIALESEAVEGLESRLVWDSARDPRQSWWPASWARDHTLGSAFRNSAVWYYQEVARRIGTVAMTAYLDRLGYGNRGVGEAVDRFWLSGELLISADEQVDFLVRMYHNTFGFAPTTITTIRHLLIMEDVPGQRLSGKTGWAGFGDPSAPQVGWFVGFLERNESTYFFALNLDIHEPEDARARVALVRDALRRLGLTE